MTRRRAVAAQLIKEAGDFNERSIRFARGISDASTGERLGRIMKDCMKAHPGAYVSGSRCG